MTCHYPNLGSRFILVEATSLAARPIRSSWKHYLSLGSVVALPNVSCFLNLKLAKASFMATNPPPPPPPAAEQNFTRNYMCKKVTPLPEPRAAKS